MKTYGIEKKYIDSHNNLIQNITGVPIFDSDNNQYIECHVYDLTDNLLSSVYELPFKVSTNIPYSIYLNIHEDVRTAGYYSGEYKVKYKYLQSILGVPGNESLIIDTISSDRFEIRVILIDPNESNQIVLNRFNNITNINKIVSNFKVELLLNLGNDKTYKISHWKLDDFTYSDRLAYILKLKEQLPEEITNGDIVSIQLLLSDDIIDYIKLIPSNNEIGVNVLASPNFLSKQPNQYQGQTTPFLNWNQLLSTNNDISSRIISKYISGSKVELNVDYSDFNNFIFYSSATKRLSNFKDKIKELEIYDNALYNIQTLAPVSASLSQSVYYTNEVNKYNSKKNELIGSFDNYERYMFFESKSLISTEETDYIPYTWPKSSLTKPYSLYSYSSSVVETWYNSIYSTASIYDNNNYNALTKTIPEWIQNDAYNEKYIEFVKMVAQQFDELWLYINQYLDIFQRDEDLYKGISKDLVYHALLSLGWDVSDFYQSNDLWDYLLGTDEVGNYQPSSSINLNEHIVYVESQSLSKSEVSKEIWKRLLNNLPSILKTKGTKESIQTILNCYGIPPTILRIKEYGGPEQLSVKSKYRYDKFNYSLGFNGTDNFVEIPRAKTIQTDRTPDSIEFRFKTINAETDYFSFNSSSLSNQSLFRTLEGGISFNIEYTSGVFGNLTMTYAVISESTPTEGRFTLVSNAPIFNGEWWSCLINKDIATDLTASNQIISTYLKQGRLANIVQEYSSSINFSNVILDSYTKGLILNSFYSSSTWYLGGGLIGPTGSLSGSDQSFLKLNPFYGNMQEFRYWSPKLSETAFDNHVLCPIAFNYDLDVNIEVGFTGSYTNLIYRQPLGTDLNHPIASYYVLSNHPNQNILNFSGSIPTYASMSYTGSITWGVEIEEYAAEWPDLSGNRSISNKVRIEDSIIIDDTPNYNILDNKRSRELSSFDKYATDNAKLGIYFSPTNEVNEDIACQFAGMRIDDYIAFPSEQYSDSYPRLDFVKNFYLKKFNGQYGVIDYIRLIPFFNQTLWNQIKKVAPARTKLITGLVVEPHILNRSKISYYRNPPTYESCQYTGSIEDFEFTLTSDYTNYEGTIIPTEPTFSSNIENIIPTNDVAISTMATASGEMQNTNISTEVWTQTCLWEISSELNSVDTSVNNLNQTLGGSFYINDSFSSGARINPSYSGVHNQYNDDVQPVITSSRQSEHRQVYWATMSGSRIIRTYSPAEVQDYLPLSMENLLWNGCKISSPGFNVAPILGTTPDGGPPVEFFITNPNIIRVNTLQNVDNMESNLIIE